MVKFRENVFGSQKQHIGNSQTIMRQGGIRVTSSISRRVTKHVRLPPGAPRLINRWHHHRLLIMSYWHGVKDRGGQKPETGELPSALHAGNTRSSVTELSNRNDVHKPGVMAPLLLSRFHRVISRRCSLAAAGCASCECQSYRTIDRDSRNASAESILPPCPSFRRGSKSMVHS